MSRDAAYRLSVLSLTDRESILKSYDEFKDPDTVFRHLSDPKRVRRLTEDRISKFIVIETKSDNFLSFRLLLNSRYPGLCSGHE